MLMSALIAAAIAAPLKPAAVTASTELPEADGVSYYAKNAADGKVSSVWVEGDTEGSGLGAYVTYEFDGPKTVTSFKIWNGNWYSYDFWNRHNRIKEIEVTFSDDSKQTFTLNDEMAAQVITLPSPVSTTSMKFKVKSIHRGTTFNDTVISELVVYDNASTNEIPVVSWSSSSVYPADADGSYEPINTTDGVIDTMWCEGSTDGDGTGEWLQADFGGSVTVRSLQLVNGNGYSMPIWMKANRANTATLTFSNGSTQQITLKNSFLSQTVEISPVSTSSVKIQFDEVTKGKEFNDLCISELAFQE